MSCTELPMNHNEMIDVSGHCNTCFSETYIDEEEDMTSFITSQGKILSTNDRDHYFILLNILLDQFLEERKQAGGYYQMGIGDKCLATGFIMYLKDAGLVEFK